MSQSMNIHIDCVAMFCTVTFSRVQAKLCCGTSSCAACTPTAFGRDFLVMTPQPSRSPALSVEDKPERMAKSDRRMMGVSQVSSVSAANTVGVSK